MTTPATQTSSLRYSFNQKLKSVQQRVLDLGYTVEANLAEATTALTTKDIPAAQQIITATFILAAKQSAIETEILSTIATQQPVARDLRLLVALLEISNELKHLSDYTASVAQASLNLGQETLLEPFQRLIPAMVETGRHMLRQSLLALDGQDVLLARAIPPQDDVVDQLYEEFCRELGIVVRADPQAAIQATLMNRVAHNLERTADRVINICEWVVFAVTGEMKELNLNSN